MEEPVHPSLFQRKIIHFDMDCFYAAVEMRDNPNLRGKPIIVGGPPNSRGVVATCSYEARRFGVRSAMASSHAFRLCPEAIFIRGDFDKYREASTQIRQIFSEYTDLIEPVSLDEAYLDVTHHELYATQIAKQIKLKIQTEVRLSGSAGVAPNKLVAKIASDIQKPNGLTVVIPEGVRDFMKPLSLRKINGVGPVTEEKLKKKNFRLCSDLWTYSIEDLKEILGDRLGAWLYFRSRGIDERPVETYWERKSLGSEITFATDFLNQDSMKDELKKLSWKVSSQLLKKDLSGRRITLKVRYFDFQRITRSITLDTPTRSQEIFFQKLLLLLNKTEAGRKPIRLLGLSVSSFSKENLEGEQGIVFSSKTFRA